MEFSRVLQLIGEEPVFETALLLAGKVSPMIVRQQLTRWAKSGRLIQLRRGLYALATPYQKTRPHPFLVANRLQRASYVSCQSALSYYGMIPESLQATVSITAGRPERLETPLGIFEFHHIKPGLLRGYRMTNLGLATATQTNQQALVATPEKALLDLVYLQPDGDTPAFLHGLRLQNLDRLKLDELNLQVEAYNIPKLHRAAMVITRLVNTESQEYANL